MPAPRALLACDLGDVEGDLLRLREPLAGGVAGWLRAGARYDVLRHPALAGTADQDRVQNALLAHRADLVQVRTGHALRPRGLQRVAAPAVLSEQRLAFVEVMAALLGRERALRALRGLPVGQNERGDGDSQAHVDDRDRDPEASAALREVGLARPARTDRQS